jgi:predicted dehydrogenase
MLKDVEQNQPEQQPSQSRRTVLKALAGIPILGVFGYELMKKQTYDKNKNTNLIKKLGLDDLQPSTKITNAGDGKLLRIGMVGFGNRANALAKALGFMHPSKIKAKKKNGTISEWQEQDNLNVAIVGICDVFDLHAKNGLAIANCDMPAGNGIPSKISAKRYRTYQEMLQDETIDAIVVATPDHHHARITTDAIKAGKHVYCEKSIALTEEELNEVYSTVKSSDRVFQLGHQITQNAIFQQAKQVIKKDILGKITLVETTTNRNTPNGAWIRHLDANGNPKQGSLSSIDWEQWLGNRPKTPFTIDRYYNWTKFFDYDTGMLGQLFSHEYDAVNQLLRMGIPKSAVASGGIYYWKDNREMPDTLQVAFEYPEKEMTLLYSASLANSRKRSRFFMGHDASMELGGSLSITADKNSTKYKQQIKDGLIDTKSPMVTVSPRSGLVDAVTSATEKYYASRGLTSTVINGKRVDVTHLHIKEWINCIRNGGETSANIERAFEEGVTILMAHKSYIEKRRVEWDPVLRKIV